jgi:hypothetical protein
MLGLVNKLSRTESNCFYAVKNKAGNVYRVNLQPWDVVETVAVSPLYRDGKKITPAATQEDFKLILERNPGMEKDIKELTAEQEKAAVASLSKSCRWYQDAQKKTVAPPIATAPKIETPLK